MSVVNSIEDSGPCRKVLTIEVPAPAVEAEVARVVAEFGRHARVPGFRKGKVPARLVMQMHRKEIDAEVCERLLPRYWKQAEAESGIDPLIAPEVLEEVEVEDGEPLVFKAAVEVRPAIEIGDLGDLQIPDDPVEPTPDEVDDALEDLRKRHGTWGPVDRAVAQGDRVSLLVKPLDEPDAPESPEGESTSPRPPAEQSLEVEVGGDRVWEELSVAVTGLTQGQSAEFTRREPKAGEEDEEPKERTFKATVEAVKELELPDLDDDFASSVGDFETSDALRQGVSDRIRQAKEQARDQRRRQTLLDQLRDRHALELPERVVQREIERLLQDYAENLASQGLDLEKAGIDWGSMAEQARPDAEKRVHARLVLDAVVARQELKISEQEFETTLSAIAKAQNTSTVAVRQALDKAGRLGSLREQMLRDKAVKHLLGEDEEPPAEDLSED